VSRYQVSDDCLDSVFGVLKNKLGIQDEAALEAVEADFAATRSFELWQSPLQPPFTPKTIQTIHRRLFGDIYEWAGTYRTIDISKGSSRFANCNHIASSLETLSVRLKAENYLQKTEARVFSNRAAYYMGELNAIHPFREGNGRTQREFLNQLARANDLYIGWQAIAPGEILEATILSFQGRCQALESLIFNNLAQF
jgi:cell filamentation protein